METLPENRPEAEATPPEASAITLGEWTARLDAAGWDWQVQSFMVGLWEARWRRYSIAVWDGSRTKSGARRETAWGSGTTLALALAETQAMLAKKGRTIP